MRSQNYAVVTVTCVVALLSPLVARCAVIASTTFDGRTVSGKTASNLNWRVSGVADPGALTASHSLFNTTDAQDMFAVAYNLNTRASWTVDVPLHVSAEVISLGAVTMDVFILSNSGNYQPQNRDVDVSVTLLDASKTTLDSVTVANVYPENNNLPVQPQSASFDFTGHTLSANTSYYLRVAMFSNTTQGNNAGFDNFSISTTAVVPEPASSSMGVLLGVAAMWHFRRRRRRPLDVSGAL